MMTELENVQLLRSVLGLVREVVRGNMPPSHARELILDSVCEGARAVEQLAVREAVRATEAMRAARPVSVTMRTFSRIGVQMDRRIAGRRVSVLDRRGTVRVSLRFTNDRRILNGRRNPRGLA